MEVAVARRPVLFLSSSTNPLTLSLLITMLSMYYL